MTSRGLTKHVIPAFGLCILAAGCSQNPSVMVEKGKKAAAEGKYAEAEIDDLKATKAKPDFGEAWYALGVAQFKQGHLGDAFQSITRASDLLPSREDIAVSLAEISMAVYIADPTRPAARARLVPLSTRTCPLRCR